MTKVSLDLQKAKEELKDFLEKETERQKACQKKYFSKMENKIQLRALEATNRNQPRMSDDPSWMLAEENTLIITSIENSLSPKKIDKTMTHKANVIEQIKTLPTYNSVVQKRRAVEERKARTAISQHGRAK